MRKMMEESSEIIATAAPGAIPLFIAFSIKTPYSDATSCMYGFVSGKAVSILSGVGFDGELEASVVVLGSILEMVTLSSSGG
ncbi:MAG: hypothetical protein U5K54_08120 [Cytophagales bacterium]|nr:hypothetical protein [Cytophagales bacterium]